MSKSTSGVNRNENSIVSGCSAGRNITPGVVVAISPLSARVNPLNMSPSELVAEIPFTTWKRCPAVAVAVAVPTMGTTTLLEIAPSDPLTD
jgi:hypothetical protein